MERQNNDYLGRGGCSRVAGLRKVCPSPPGGGLRGVSDDQFPRFKFRSLISVSVIGFSVWLDHRTSGRIRAALVFKSPMARAWARANLTAGLPPQLSLKSSFSVSLLARAK